MSHVHHCPICFERQACNMACDIEPDLRLDDGTESGAHTECDACARASDGDSDRNTSIRVRALKVHAELWRAMNDTDAGALAALRDDGYVHAAVHALLAGDDALAPVPEAWAAHVAAQDERIGRLEAELAEARKTVQSQRGELTKQQHAIRQKNAQLDALHFVWCSGTCDDGTHRHGGELTEEIVVEAERNTRRLRERVAGEERGAREMTKNERDLERLYDEIQTICGHNGEPIAEKQCESTCGARCERPRGHVGCHTAIGHGRWSEPNAGYVPALYPRAKKLDAIGELFALLEECGATMTLHGTPISNAALRKVVEAKAAERLRHASPASTGHHAPPTRQPAWSR